MHQTPGQWRRGSHRSIVVDHPDGTTRRIAEVWSGACDSLEQSDANEALIAAAPDLQRDAIVAAGLLKGAAEALEIAGAPATARLLLSHVEQIARTVQDSVLGVSYSELQRRMRAQQAHIAPPAAPLSLVKTVEVTA